MDVSSGTEHEDRFRRVYAGNFAPLLAYAMRRVEQPEDAADVVAETFLVAWRRRHEMPARPRPGCGCTAWPGGCSPTTTAAACAGERLGERLRQRLTAAVAADPGSEVAERLAVQAALARLGELDREVLMLTVWEGLEPREVAAVLRLSPDAVRTRLSRARARLRDLVGDDLAPPGHVLDVMTAPARRRADDRRAARPDGPGRRPLPT